jgi:hypothetical protein
MSLHSLKGLTLTACRELKHAVALSNLVQLAEGAIVVSSGPAEGDWEQHSGGGWYNWTNLIFCHNLLSVMTNLVRPYYTVCRMCVDYCAAYACVYVVRVGRQGSLLYFCMRERESARARGSLAVHLCLFVWPSRAPPFSRFS